MTERRKEDDGGYMSYPDGIMRKGVWVNDRKPQTPFPGLGARLAVALEAAGVDTIEKLEAVIRDDILMAVPGVNTFDQAETIKAWLKMNRRNAR